MGVYVYRVTAQRVRCSDGAEANVAVFAYKPTSCGGTVGSRGRYVSAESFNHRWDFVSGCPASRRLAREGKLTGRIVLGDRPKGSTTATIVDPARVFTAPRTWGTFYDDAIGASHSPMQRLLNVTVQP